MLPRVPYVKLLPYNALVLITAECPLINLRGDALQTTVRIINTRFGNCLYPRAELHIRRV